MAASPSEESPPDSSTAAAACTAASTARAAAAVFLGPSSAAVAATADFPSSVNTSSGDTAGPPRLRSTAPAPGGNRAVMKGAAQSFCGCGSSATGAPSGLQSSCDPHCRASSPAALSSPRRHKPSAPPCARDASSAAFTSALGCNSEAAAASLTYTPSGPTPTTTPKSQCTTGTSGIASRCASTSRSCPLGSPWTSTSNGSGSWPVLQADAALLLLHLLLPLLLLLRGAPAWVVSAAAAPWNPAAIAAAKASSTSSWSPSAAAMSGASPKPGGGTGSFTVSHFAVKW
mmetsp:Transcript_3532/g.14670  ORF Transcript_3532/g.14670 Transcript_3532/m.14670 type:complete len:287 (+) Transcript_3532:1160-2020(+)